MTDELADWKRRFDALLAGRLDPFDRAEVLAETPSTQDAALDRAAGSPGLILAALRQTEGRGRLGRTWHDAPEKGLAVSFVLDGAAYSMPRVSLASGMAACFACETAMTESAVTGGGIRPGLRWPNDVVAPIAGRERKLAGVLIERRGGLLIVGIGVNVRHATGDWPHELQDRAASLAELGCQAGRGEILSILCRSMSAALALSPAELARDWARRDVLVGSVRSFFHDGRTYTGRIVGIEPDSHIRLEAPSGPIQLPCQSTSLVHDH